MYLLAGSWRGRNNAQGVVLIEADGLHSSFPGIRSVYVSLFFSSFLMRKNGSLFVRARLLPP